MGTSANAQAATLSFVVDVTLDSVAPQGLGRIDPVTNEVTTGGEPPDAQELPFALVKCLVNGVEPLLSTPGRPFDALTFVFYGLASEEHDFWTCSCGEAGCAGLHDGVRVSLSEASVYWTFPLRTYQNKFSAEFRETLGVPAPLSEEQQEVSEDEVTLVFSRVQYEQALAGLKARLMELKEENPLLQLIPSSLYEDPQKSALAAIWASAEQHALSRNKARALHQEVFGDMVGLWLDLQTPLGAFQISPSGWRAAISPDSAWDDSSEEAVLAYNTAAVLMRASRSAPSAFVRSLAWPNVCLQALPVEYSADAPNALPVNADEAFLSEVQASWRSARS